MYKLNKKDPFQVEKYRNYLAKNNLLDEFLETYSNDFSSIENLNTPKFWDKVFLNKEQSRSFITIDKNKKIINILNRKNGKLLDVGLGNGLIEREILKSNSKNFLLYGIDISETAISNAMKNLKGEFLKGSIFNIPYEDNFFDAILCLEVLEHIAPLQIFKALSELYRTLKKDGVLIISIPLNEELEILYRKGENPSGHVRTYSTSIISAELKIAGFNLVEKKYFFAFETFYNLKNFLRKFFLRNRWQPNDLLVVARKGEKKTDSETSSE